MLDEGLAMLDLSLNRPMQLGSIGQILLFIGKQPELSALARKYEGIYKELHRSCGFEGLKLPLEENCCGCWIWQTSSDHPLTMGGKLAVFHSCEGDRIRHERNTISLDRPSLMRQPLFRRLFAAFALSCFGDWFDAIAISVIVVYRWGTDPLMLALMPAAMALPGLLLGTLGGALAHRLPGIRLMLICDVAVVLLTIGIAFAPHLAVLLPLLLLRSAAGVFHTPAQQALTRSIVDPEDLQSASSWNGLVSQGSKIAALSSVPPSSPCCPRKPASCSMRDLGCSPSCCVASPQTASTNG